MALQEHDTWAEELGIQTCPKESILNICPIWISWFDSSTRMSSPLRVGGCEIQPTDQNWAGPVSKLL
jgi:hypothetical protein